MPTTWAYGHLDWKYIKKIHNLFGTVQLSGFPHFEYVKTFLLYCYKKDKISSYFKLHRF